MFDLLIHADWSVNARKRWAATARRDDAGWVVDGPTELPDVPSFLEQSFDQAKTHRVLLGFDFPIGVPQAYGTKTGFQNFTEMLATLGNGEWHTFFDVADAPGDISIRRPFFPRSPTKGVSRTALVEGLGMDDYADLLRICEQPADNLRAACALFWTLGGNQVGKGALAGWRDVILPAVRRGASLWPFDGTLAQLSERSRLVLAETYPAAAYRMVDAPFASGESKRRQCDRKRKTSAITNWADRHRLRFTKLAQSQLADGFGSHATGEDRYDALLGLLGMIAVTGGHQPERSIWPETGSAWEGWILGR
ncbi:hypothetical protein [Acidiphilium sp.]|uniref:hypothetical protein n=2 Tax=Acidiphilium sp. TaxID=527 RepID=UPI0025881DBC|nr:hypothetical protein [Acidiphilium sp.]